MDFQTIIVGLIILAALVYVGSLVLNKAKSFSSKSACGSDCGCESKAPGKNFAALTKRN